MTHSLFTKVEFLGGPEDGRILEPEVIEILQELSDPGGCLPIPVVRVDVDDQPANAGLKLEGQLVGAYVAKQIEKGTLLYVWAACEEFLGCE